ncbi:hypothetical protein Aduo_011432 [Ancylostoma duodenale]
MDADVVQDNEAMIDVVKDLKRRSDQVGKTENRREGNNEAGSSSTEQADGRLDWSVLRTKMEALCGDVFGRPVSSTRPLSKELPNRASTGEEYQRCKAA